MFERIIEWFNKIALINIVSPRRALTAYLLALSEADIDGNGELNIREILKSTKNKLIYLAFSPCLTDHEILDLTKEILDKEK